MSVSLFYSATNMDFWFITDCRRGVTLGTKITDFVPELVVMHIHKSTLFAFGSMLDSKNLATAIAFGWKIALKSCVA